MTNQQINTEVPPAEPADPEAEPSTSDTTTDDGNSDSDSGTESGNAEAAKYRRKLRDTEVERDGLAAKLAAAEQSVINWALGQTGIDPRLWELSDVDLDTLRDADGQLDPAAVINHASEIRAQVYGAGPLPNPQQGQPPGASESTWATVFDPKRHR